MDETINQFFQDYSAAFEAADGAQISSFYHVPCMTVRLDGSFHQFQSKGELADFFGNVARGYIGEGMRSGRPQSLETHKLGSASVLVTINWVIKREDGSVIRSWRQTYNLLRQGDGWAILLATMHQL